MTVSTGKHKRDYSEGLDVGDTVCVNSRYLDQMGNTAIVQYLRLKTPPEKRGMYKPYRMIGYHLEVFDTKFDPMVGELYQLKSSHRCNTLDKNTLDIIDRDLEQVWFTRDMLYAIRECDYYNRV